MPTETLYPPDRCVDTWVCDDCGATLSQDYDASYSTVSGDTICEDCAYGYESCGDCDHYSRYLGDLNRAVSGGYICDHCAQCNYWSCEYCGDYVHYDESYCEDCGDRDCDGLIRDYEYKPSPQFHGDGPLYLGLELELETGGSRDCAEIATGELGDLGYLKADSTLYAGFEIVTHPMSHQWAAENFPYGMLRKLARNGAGAEDTAGMHVHVSRDGFDGPAHVYRWMKLIYRNETGVTGVARRSSDDWAAFEPSARENVKHYAKGDREGFRYSAVNVKNANTFELRIFASTLVERELRAALDLAAASVEYTRTLTVPDIAQRGGWDWSTFGGWVAARPEYAALAVEMSA
ncbi:MAG: hypothetical protein ACRDTZ_16055 [Pseudonocardiaceae bacterium]